MQYEGKREREIRYERGKEREIRSIREREREIRSKRGKEREKMLWKLGYSVRDSNYCVLLGIRIMVLS